MFYLVKISLASRSRLRSFPVPMYCGKDSEIIHYEPNVDFITLANIIQSAHLNPQSPTDLDENDMCEIELLVRLFSQMNAHLKSSQITGFILPRILAGCISKSNVLILTDIDMQRISFAITQIIKHDD